MCLIIVKKSGVDIPNEYLQQAWKRNSHGAGYSLSRDGELVIKKGFLNYNSFIESYNSIVKTEDNCVVHFRLASVGPKTSENCHPVSINENNCIFLNGTLSKYKDVKDGRTDLHNFVDFYLKPVFNDNYLIDDSNIKQLDEVSECNKLVFFDNLGNITIINEELGIWEENNKLWLSNNYFKSQQKFYKSDKKKEELPVGIQPIYFLRDKPFPLSQSEIGDLVRRYRKSFGSRKLRLKDLVRGGIVQRCVSPQLINYYRRLGYK